MLPSSLKHRVFAYDTYVKNGKSRVCVGGDLCEISETTRLLTMQNPGHLEN